MCTKVLQRQKEREEAKLAKKMTVCMRANDYSYSYISRLKSIYISEYSSLQTHLIIPIHIFLLSM